MNTELVARYGKPVKIPGIVGLATLGLDDQGIPADDVIAFRYSSLQAAEAFAASNKRRHGHPSLGVAEENDGGAVGVTDLRPALAKLQAEQRAKIKKELR